MKTKFKDWMCDVVFAFYDNGRVAIQLVSDGTPTEASLRGDEDKPMVGEPIATATVNIPEAPCPEGHAWIKAWAENEGMVEALVKADIIGPQALTHARNGFVVSGCYPLTRKAMEEINRKEKPRG